MGGEILKDEEGKEYYIFDQSELYDDTKMGDKLEDFEFLKIEDESAKITKIISSLNQNIYLMKTVNIKARIGFGPKAKEELEKRIKDYKDIDFFYILKIYKHFKNENEMNIVFENANNGSLYNYIHLYSSLKIYVKEALLLNMFLQCITALKFLHSKKIIHKCIIPNYFLMTNEKIIKLKLRLCPDVDLVTSELYYPPENPFSEKGDIYSLGCCFYQICFLVNYDQFLKEEKKFEAFEKADTEYSKEIINIIKTMVDNDPNKRPSSEELYNTIRDLYDKEINKNSSITSLISCLYSINPLTREFLQNISNYSNKDITPISSIFSECLNNIENKNKWIESIKNLRRFFGTRNPTFDGDNEVDPFFLIVYLVENIHKELNIKPTNNFDKEEGYIMKRKEDKTNKADMVINQFRYFKEHFNSIMSKTFFGIMKTKNTCKGCGLKTYSLNSFCFLSFDIDKILSKGSNKTLKLQDFFDGLKKGTFFSDSKNDFFCQGCSKLTEHKLEKAIYYMPKSLIICFISKNNDNNYKIDFPDFADLKDEREYCLSPHSFNLQGFINKIVVNKKEKYISYFRSPINGDIFSCEDYNIKEEENG